MKIKKTIAYVVLLIVIISIFSIQGLENISKRSDLQKITINNKINVNTTMFYGTIYDNSTKNTIPNATIIALYPLSEYFIDLSRTTANACGYYNINLPNDYAVFILARAKNYFSSYHVYNEGDTPKQDTLLNFVLSPGRSIENSIIKGYIKNNYTDEPIQNAKIRTIMSFNNNTEYDLNYTISNQEGYYEIKSNNGSLRIQPTIEGYYENYSDIIINDSEILWKNFSIKPLPLINSTVKGYITDQGDNQPIIGVRVLVTSENNYGDEYSDITSTDVNGYYKTQISAGNITIQLNHPDYIEKNLDPFYINENETIYINTSMQPIITNEEFSYKWIKQEYENEIINNAYVSKDNDYIDTILVNSPSGSVITNVEFEITWKDDNTYGLLRKKGEDTLTATSTSEKGISKTDSSIGGGNITFEFSVNSIPVSDTILADDINEAIEILENMIAGENKAIFTFEIEIETGEKIFRLFKYIRDKGNNFSLIVNYTYYIYEFQEI